MSLDNISTRIVMVGLTQAKASFLKAHLWPLTIDRLSHSRPHRCNHRRTRPVSSYKRQATQPQLYKATMLAKTQRTSTSTVVRRMSMRRLGLSSFSPLSLSLTASKVVPSPFAAHGQPLKLP